MMIHRSSSALLIALLAGSSLLAQTFVVDVNGGPGTNFTSLTTAISSVPDGSTLIVRAGQYNEPRLHIIGKSLTIVGDPGLPDINLGAGGTARIQSLASHQHVTLRFLRIGAPGLGSLAFQMANNEGRITLETLVFPPAPNIDVTDCDWLVFTNMMFSGPLEVTDSNVALVDGQLVGPAYFSPVWEPALKATRSSVQIVGGLVRGAVAFGAGPDAVELDGSDLRLLADAEIEGGYQFPSTHAGRPIVGTGTLRMSPAAILSGAPPLVAATVNSTTLDMPYVLVDPAPLGATVAASLDGVSSTVGILAVGFSGPATAIAGAQDLLFLDPNSAVAQAIGAPPLTSSTSIPNAAAFVGVTLVWQGFTYDATNGLQASNPAPRTVH